MSEPQCGHLVFVWKNVLIAPTTNRQGWWDTINGRADTLASGPRRRGRLNDARAQAAIERLKDQIETAVVEWQARRTFHFLNPLTQPNLR